MTPFTSGVLEYIRGQEYTEVDLHDLKEHILPIFRRLPAKREAKDQYVSRMDILSSVGKKFYLSFAGRGRGQKGYYTYEGELPSSETNPHGGFHFTNSSGALCLPDHGYMRSWWAKRAGF
jgi:hypothetical protein